MSSISGVHSRPVGVSRMTASSPAAAEAGAAEGALAAAAPPSGAAAGKLPSRRHIPPLRAPERQLRGARKGRAAASCAREGGAPQQVRAPGAGTQRLATATSLLRARCTSQPPGGKQRRQQGDPRAGGDCARTRKGAAAARRGARRTAPPVKTGHARATLFIRRRSTGPLSLPISDQPAHQQLSGILLLPCCLTGVSDALLLARGAGFPRRVCGGGGGGTEAGGEAGSAGRALRLSAEPTMGKVRARRCMFVPTQPCALPQVYGAAVARWHTPLAQSDSPPQSQPRAAGCCPSGGACRRGKRLRDRPPERDGATRRVLARCGSSTGVGWGANSVLPPSAAGIRRR